MEMIGALKYLACATISPVIGKGIIFTKIEDHICHWLVAFLALGVAYSCGVTIPMPYVSSFFRPQS